MDLATTAHADHPARDMALTESMLRAAAARTGPELIRIFRPGPTVAFGRSEQRRSGFRAASEAARAHGREPVVRLAGGQAAAYDPRCVIVEIIRYETSSFGGIDERYADLAELLFDALAEHGVEVETGELSGEYCPGRFSLHLVDGGRKVAGIAHRIIRGASLTTAVLVVDGGDDLRATISDVYGALEIPVDADLAGAASESNPRLAADSVAGTLRALAVERYS